VGPARRLPVAPRVLASAALMLSCLAFMGPAAADIGDADPALRGWLSERPRERAGHEDPMARERRLRGASSLGPPPLRAVDRALIDAACGGRWDEALRLVKAGQAAPGARDETGAHALACAAAAGRDDVVQPLARRGAALDLPDARGLTPLGQAAWRGQRSTVRLLLRLGADPAVYSRNGHAPLHLAAIAGHVDVVNDLLARGVSIEQLNRARETAVDVAAAAQQDAVLDRLVQGGADLTKAGRR
jgi:ankyrin repeat protein